MKKEKELKNPQDTANTYYAGVFAVFAIVMFLIQLSPLDHNSVLYIFIQGLLFPVLWALGGIVAKGLAKKFANNEQITEERRLLINTAICFIFIFENLTVFFYAPNADKPGYASIVCFYSAFLLGGYIWDSISFDKIGRSLKAGWALYLISIVVSIVMGVVAANITYK